MDRTSPGTRIAALVAASGSLCALLWLLGGASVLDGQTFERGPTHSPHGALKIPCSSCHTEKNWKTLRAIPEFNHNTQTRYPLRGMHEGVKCSLCHTRLVFSQTSTRCADCHADIHRRQFGADCAQCHTVKGWTVAVQNIRDHLNRFPLLGAHATVPCDACHTGAAAGQFTGLSTACASCHMRDFNRTTAPNHAAAGFSTACETCHNMDTFLAAKFDHATTGFPLAGAHATVPCTACHVGNRFQGTPATCMGCHAQDFASAKNPDHTLAGFSTDCAACHTTASWAGAKFDHSLTKFPLTGAHASVTCDACHANGQFAGLSTACVSCHLKDYQGTTNPNHVVAGFPQDCSICHTTVNWSASSFNHSTQTKFALTGAHANVPCNVCHVNNVFAGLSMACASCHLTDFQKTTNPNHPAAGFPQDCSLCHTTVDWSGATFNHTTQTKFPLTGAHVDVACNTCHVNNVYAGLSMTCVSCHLTDFQKTTNPNHVSGGFSQDCSICHNTASWDGATFDHSKTAFPLTGAHVNVACAQCHVNNQFTGLSTACVSCHLKDFQGAKDPDHVAAGFPQDCSMCHTTAAWSGASFNHNTATKFALTGAHVNVACTTCHVNNVFAGLPMTCISCHLTDFQKTTNPNHTAAGFPQDCSLCHTTVNWSGATFDHTTQTKFPLTGAHINVSCATCHVNNVYAGLPMTCVSCHLTDFQKTTNPNHVAGGFSQDCQVCHSTTDWSGATFDHSKTAFPLTGAHVSVACNVCHVNNVFAGLSTACISCHLKDYQGATSPNHVAAGFPQDCSMCHTTTDWSGASFDHTAQTKFPLTGAHIGVACNVCHVNNVFAGLSTACVSCHLTDFQKTTNPNHVAAGFPQDCSLCHTTVNWSGATFNHTTQTKFALTGAHINVACNTCHVNNVFAGLPMTCVSCHLTDFQKTTDPNHVAAGLPQDCSLCHTTVNWSGAAFDHSKTPFPLTGAHVSVACAACHLNNVFAGLSTDCVSCHLKDYQGAKDPDHVAAGFPQDCSMCHTTADWSGASFNHTTQTKFPLTGAHVSVACNICHVNNVFAGLSMACISCHLKDWQGTTNPNHAAAAFPQTCDTCHTTTNWLGATFDHTAQTKFPLTGAHIGVACNVCHVNNVFAGLSTACASCHLTDFQKTTDPNHVAAGFPQDCSLCHTTVDWSGATFNHTTQTKFALTGAHINVACNTCHVNNVFAGLPTACISCHLKDWQGTTNPNHAAAAFPQTCDTCHTTTDWSGATFNHTTQTKFPLTGAHVNVACNVCHLNNVYAGLSMACYSCHATDYQGTTDPNHVAAGFPQDCSMCHATVNWSGATFNHTTQTTFPLTGAHIAVPCATCHVNNVFAGLSTACISCHLKDWQGTTNPNHAAAAFPQTCDTCHTTTNWLGATFDHTAQTKFPLTGAHINVPCATCHVNNVFAGLSTACVSCHLTDFQTTTDPNHVAAGFPQDCSMCHTTVNWSGATFNHTTQTTFPLTGAHISVPCSTCHVNNVFAGLPTACISCHLKDWQGTTDPNHAAAGFPQTCDTCHTTTNWLGATFDHTAQTKFPLTGAHINVACNVCHVNNVFAGLSTACVSCHLTDFQTTTDPNHVAGGFSQDCQVCHSTTSWAGAQFDHSKTAFPLTGAHVSVACATCHVNNVFAGLSTACISCHLKDYQGATSPNHVAAGFPQDCSMCHTTTDWSGASFNHTTQTKFPLTGAHVTVACTTCHVNGVFAGLPMTCISCHLKDYQGTTQPNHVAAGFPQDCSMCHTTVNWSGATFNHSTQTTFPLTGAHISVPCSTCHVNNVFAGLSTACISCHLKDWQGTTNPNHAAAAFPQTCDTCHTTTNWLGATFNHNTQTKFPLTGAHVNVACSTCHLNNVYAGLSTACISCHLKDYQGTTRPQSRRGRVPPGLLPLPHHRGLVRRHLQPQHGHDIPPDGRARQRRLRHLPCEQRLRRALHGLHFLPPEGLAGNHQPESRRGGLPADLRHLPHHHQLVGRDVQPQHSPSSRSPART